jgi:hypothetical protein
MSIEASVIGLALAPGPEELRQIGARDVPRRTWTSARLLGVWCESPRLLRCGLWHKDVIQHRATL